MTRRGEGRGTVGRQGKRLEGRERRRKEEERMWRRRGTKG